MPWFSYATYSGHILIKFIKHGITHIMLPLRQIYAISHANMHLQSGTVHKVEFIAIFIASIAIYHLPMSHSAKLN